MCDPNNHNSYPKIELLYQYFVKCIDNIHEWVVDVREKFLKRRGFK